MMRSWEVKYIVDILTQLRHKTEMRFLTWDVTIEKEEGWYNDR